MVNKQQSHQSDSGSKSAKTDSTKAHQESQSEFINVESIHENLRFDDLSSNQILYLQRTIGNQGVLQLINGSQTASPIQRSTAHERGCTCSDCARIQRHTDDEEVQLQRHEDEDVQLQRHHDEDMQLQRQVLIQRSGHEKGCTCPDCAQIQRHADEEVQLQRHADEEVQLQRHHDEDMQLQRQVLIQRSGHEKGCTCPDCAKVQRHADEEVQLQRHHDEDMQLQRHADEEVQLQRHHDEDMQLQRSENVESPNISHAAPDDGIQRHVAYEHYVLGQVEPDKLANLSFMREVKAAVDAYEKLKELQDMGEISPNFEIKDPYSAEEKKENKKKMLEAKHTLEQEMARLLEWRNNPQAMNNKEDKVGVVEKQGNDDKWQVPVVKMPVTRDDYNEQNHQGNDRYDSIIVTYSEINTLPDFFGNPETIKNTKKATVLSMLQGVRQQSYIELSNIYEELFDENVNALHNNFTLDDDFQDAIGPRGQAVNEWVYEKRTEMQLNDASKAGGEGGSQQYFAALERNACHFAPYSWDQWQTYHEQARQKAIASKEAEARGQQENDENAKSHAKELANEALLLNAFGEHYLQDSFAAGHLIDKTGIMQAFVKWMGTRNKLLGLGEMGSSDRAKSQWQMTKMIANQDLGDNEEDDAIKNPQALDDAIMKGDLDSTQDAARRVGLKTTGDIIFLMWWRSAATKDTKLQRLSSQAAAANYPREADQQTVQSWLDALVSKNFAEKDEVNRFNPFAPTRIEYVIDPAQLKAIDPTADEDERAYNAGTGDKSLETQAAEFNLAAYNSFLNNAYVQGATKYFHDTYCRQGLDVITGEGAHIGTIYGDANMLNAGAQKGVEYSAETSQMSREAIFNILGGTPDKAADTTDIRKRFPTKVKIKDDTGKVVDVKSLANWNTEYLYTPKMMDKAASAGARAAYKAKRDGSISDGNAIDMEAIANLPEQPNIAPEVNHGEGEF